LSDVLDAAQEGLAGVADDFSDGASRLQFLPNLPELCPHTVASGLPLKLEDSTTCAAADKRKAQKIEGFRLAEPALLAVMHRKASELDQSGLLGMK
jgi:hypothetical protein